MPRIDKRHKVKGINFTYYDAYFEVFSEDDGEEGYYKSINGFQTRE